MLLCLLLIVPLALAMPTRPTTRRTRTTTPLTTIRHFTTTIPTSTTLRGCLSRHRPGQVISSGRSGNWCYWSICGRDGNVIHADDFNCGTTTTFRTTTPPYPPTTPVIPTSTTPPIPKRLSKRSTLPWWLQTDPTGFGTRSSEGTTTTVTTTGGLPWWVTGTTLPWWMRSTRWPEYTNTGSTPTWPWKTIHPTHPTRHPTQPTRRTTPDSSHITEDLETTSSF